MLKLFFKPVCPISNIIIILTRLLGIETSLINVQTQKKLEQLTIEAPWTSCPCFYYNDNFIFGLENIIFFLYDQFPNKSVLQDWRQNRSLMNFDKWLTNDLYQTLYFPLMYEKTIKSFYGYTHEISFETVRVAQSILTKFLVSVDELLKKSPWVSLGKMTINDITLFSFLSTIDYFGYIVWNRFINLKKWYMRMKSQESYNFILKYKIDVKPVNHYNSLDF